MPPSYANSQKVRYLAEQLRPIQNLDTRVRVAFDFARSDRLFKLAVEVETGYRKFTGKGGEIAKINAECLRWVKDRAAANLEESIQKNQRFKRTNTKRLERAIRSPKWSRSSETGFQFLIHSPALLEEVPYYLAVEVGSRASVGRYLPLLFLGKAGDGPISLSTNETQARALRTPRAPDPTRGNNRGRNAKGHFLKRSARSALPTERTDGGRQTRFKTDRIIGPSERARQKGGDFKGARFSRDNAFFVQIKRPVPAYHYAANAAADFTSEKIFDKKLELRKAAIEKKTKAKLKIFNGPASLNR